MKILAFNPKGGTIKLKAENLDDLWYLSGIIEPKDLVTGLTQRKIKLGDSTEGNAKIIKKTDLRK